MAVTQTGSDGLIENGAQTSSQSITVPTDADLAVVGVSGYANAGQFDGGAADDASTANLTLGGTQMKVGKVYDDSVSFGFSGIFYLANPPTGSQTLAWDWESASDGVVFHYIFYKGVDTSSVIASRDEDHQTGSSGSVTLTVGSGDMVYCAVYGYSGTIGWTNATEYNESTYNSVIGAFAYNSGGSNVTVTATSSSYITICGIVINASAAGGESIVPLVANYYRRMRG